MKKLFLLPLLLAALLAAPTNLIAGTYDKDIQIAAGGVSVDSVRLRVEVDNTQIDSALWNSFPVDSFITLPDTAILTLSYWYYFTDDGAEAIPYTTAYEQIGAANPTGGYIDSIVEGDGTGSFTYKAVDTANDIAVQFVSVTAYNTAGNILGIPQLTDGSGFTVWGFTVGDTIIFQTAQTAGWTWEQDDSIITVTNGGLDSTMGFGPNIGTPAGGNECRVFGYAYDILDTADAMANVWVFIEPTAQANNTCDSTLTPRFMKRKLTDATGKFEFDVVRSSCLGDTEYRIWLRWEGGQTDKHEFVAPDQATFRILW